MKWMVAKRYLRYEALFTAVFLFFIFVQLTSFGSSFRDWPTIPICIMLIGNFGLEVLSFVGSPVAYIFRFWNLANLIGSIFLTYSIITESNPVDPLTFGILLLYLKGVSFLRIFDNTRILIRLVIEVIKDLGPFVIFLLCIMFISSLVSYTLTIQTD